MKSVRVMFLSAACAAALAGGAMAGPVSVPVVVQMDNVALVSFKSPVSMVYIGNPSIAELTILDARHVFVMGKRFGATNLIALGPDKMPIENDPVTVSSRSAAAVTVFRGDQTYNYVCTGFHCETRPVPGDPKAYFDNTEGTASEHEDAATKMAGGAQVSQGR
jgi:hypothetical protein